MLGRTKPCVFFINELQDLAVSRIVELVRFIIEGPMADKKRSTLVLFVTESQRDALYASLTSAFGYLLSKVYHGIVLCNHMTVLEGTAIQVLQPFLMCFLSRGGGDLIEIPLRTLELHYFEDNKVKLDAAMVDYKKPMHPDVILEMTRNLLNDGWQVALYQMGFAVEKLLCQGRNVNVIDTPHQIEFFDTYYSCTTFFEEENVKEEGSEENVEDEGSESQGDDSSSSDDEDESSESSDLRQEEIRTKNKGDQLSTRVKEVSLIIREHLRQ